MLSIAIIALLIPSQPNTKPLTITGDTITVVRSFPITITAPPNADYYSWNVPSNVQHTKSKNVLTITSAQGGELKVSVECVTWKIDFEKKTKDVVTEVYDTSMIIGGVLSKKDNKTSSTESKKLETSNTQNVIYSPPIVPMYFIPNNSQPMFYRSVYYGGGIMSQRGAISSCQGGACYIR